MMKPRRAVLAAMLSISGCSVLPARPYQERRQWALTARRPAAIPAAAGAKILLVRTLQAGPGLDGRALQSLAADGSVSLDNWEEWQVTPADGVEAALREWLADCGRYEAVIGPGSRLEPDLVLEGELLALITEPARGRARISAGIVLSAKRGGRWQPLRQIRLEATAPLNTAGGAAEAAALNQALAALLAQIEDSLRA